MRIPSSEENPLLAFDAERMIVDHGYVSGGFLRPDEHQASRWTDEKTGFSMAAGTWDPRNICNGPNTSDRQEPRHIARIFRETISPSDLPDKLNLFRTRTSTGT